MRKNLKNLFAKTSRAFTNTKVTGSLTPRTLRCEPLEQRQMLAANIFVNTPIDVGQVDLTDNEVTIADAATLANDEAGQDTVILDFSAYKLADPSWDGTVQVGDDVPELTGDILLKNATADLLLLDDNDGDGFLFQTGGNDVIFVGNIKTAPTATLSASVGDTLTSSGVSNVFILDSSASTAADTTNLSEIWTLSDANGDLLWSSQDPADTPAGLSYDAAGGTSGTLTFTNTFEGYLTLSFADGSDVQADAVEVDVDGADLDPIGFTGSSASGWSFNASNDQWELNIEVDDEATVSGTWFGFSDTPSIADTSGRGSIMVADDGTWTWTFNPNSDWATGLHSVSLFAQEGGNFEFTNFLLVLEEDAPTITPDQVTIDADEGDLASTTLTISDHTEGLASVTASFGTIEHISGSTYLWSYTPSADDGSFQVATITATDLSNPGLASTAMVFLNVRDTVVTDFSLDVQQDTAEAAGTWTLAGNVWTLEVEEDDLDAVELTGTWGHTKGAAEDLTFAVTYGTENAVLAGASVTKNADGTWELSLAGTTLTSGDYPVKVTVTDQSGDTAEVAFQLVVVESVPTLTPTNALMLTQEIWEGQTATATFNITDFNEDITTVVASVGNITQTPGTDEWVWSYTPASGDGVVGDVVITATDSSGASNTATISLTVNDSLPTIAIDDVQSTVIGNGTWFVVPGGAETTRVLAVELDDLANVAISGTWGHPNETLTVTGVATPDAAGDPIDLPVVSTGPGAWAINFASVTSLAPGSYTVTLETMDSDADAATATFTLVVQASAPLIALPETPGEGIVATIDVTVQESQTATASFVITDFNEQASLDAAGAVTASFGEIAYDATANSGAGAWVWTATTTSAADSQEVTISATDRDGAVSTVTIDLTVTSVVPEIAIAEDGVDIEAGKKSLWTVDAEGNELIVEPNTDVTITGTWAHDFENLDTENFDFEVTSTLANASLVPNADGTWDFTFNSGETLDLAGQEITITLTDSTGDVAEVVFTLIVADASPIITLPLGGETVTFPENETESFTFIVSDHFGTVFAENATMTVSLGTVVYTGTPGEFEWNPPEVIDGINETIPGDGGTSVTQAQPRTVTITATITDDGEATTFSSEQDFSLVVTNAVPQIDAAIEEVIGERETDATFTFTVEDVAPDQLADPSSVVVSVESGPDQYEAGTGDNTAEDARLVELDAPCEVHTIGDNSDVDWFKFELTEMTDVSILTDVYGSDTILHLYEADGETLIADNDDRSDKASLGSRIDAIDLEAGTYFVKIIPFGLSSGLYSISFHSEIVEEGYTNDIELIAAAPQADLEVVLLDANGEVVEGVEVEYLGCERFTGKASYQLSNYYSLGVGTHELTIQATDKDGGVSTSELTIIVEATPPTLDVLTGATLQEDGPFAGQYLIDVAEGTEWVSVTGNWTDDAASEIVSVEIRDITDASNPTEVPGQFFWTPSPDVTAEGFTQGDWIWWIEDAVNNGENVFEITITTAEGATSSLEFVFITEDVPPTFIGDADVVPGQSVITEGETATWTLPAMQDPGVEDAITEYVVVWQSTDFETGTEEFEARRGETRYSAEDFEALARQISVNFLDSGNYEVQISVVDNEAEHLVKTLNVEVQNTATEIVAGDLMQMGSFQMLQLTLNDVALDLDAIASGVEGASITASVGSLIDNGGGSWTWLWAPPADSPNVELIITANDGDATTTYTCAVVVNDSSVLLELSGVTTSVTDGPALGAPVDAGETEFVRGKISGYEGACTISGTYSGGDPGYVAMLVPSDTAPEGYTLQYAAIASNGDGTGTWSFDFDAEPSLNAAGEIQIVAGGADGVTEYDGDVASLIVLQVEIEDLVPSFAEGAVPTVTDQAGASVDLMTEEVYREILDDPTATLSTDQPIYMITEAEGQTVTFNFPAALNPANEGLTYYWGVIGFDADEEMPILIENLVGSGTYEEFQGITLSADDYTEYMLIFGVADGDGSPLDMSLLTNDNFQEDGSIIEESLEKLDDAMITALYVRNAPTTITPAGNTLCMQSMQSTPVAMPLTITDPSDTFGEADLDASDFMFDIVSNDPDKYDESVRTALETRGEIVWNSDEGRWDFQFVATQIEELDATVTISLADPDTGEIVTGSFDIIVGGGIIATNDSETPGFREGEQVNVNKLDFLTTETGTWSMTRDGQSFSSFSTNYDGSLSFTPPDNGTYVVTLVVPDDGYNQFPGDYSTTVVVTNVAPNVTFVEMQDDQGNAVGIDGAEIELGTGEGLTFVTSFNDPGSETPTVTVNWGDVDGSGQDYISAVSYSGNVIYSPAFTAAGTYTVVATIDDGDGGVVYEMFDLVVTSPAFVAEGEIVTSGDLVEGSLATITAPAVEYSGNGTLVYGYTIWAADATGQKVGEPFESETDCGSSVTLAPGGPGDFIFEFSVTDEFGNIADTVAQVFTVANESLTLDTSVTSLSCGYGSTRSLSVKITDPGLEEDWDNQSDPVGVMLYDSTDMPIVGATFEVSELTFLDDETAQVTVTLTAGLTDFSGYYRVVADDPDTGETVTADVALEVSANQAPTVGAVTVTLNGTEYTCDYSQDETTFTDYDGNELPPLQVGDSFYVTVGNAIDPDAAEQEVSGDLTYSWTVNGEQVADVTGSTGPSTDFAGESYGDLTFSVTVTDQNGGATFLNYELPTFTLGGLELETAEGSTSVMNGEMLHFETDSSVTFSFRASENLPASAVISATLDGVSFLASDIVQDVSDPTLYTVTFQTTTTASVTPQAFVLTLSDSDGNLSSQTVTVGIVCDLTNLENTGDTTYYLVRSGNSLRVYNGDPAADGTLVEEKAWNEGFLELTGTTGDDEVILDFTNGDLWTAGSEISFDGLAGNDKITIKSVDAWSGGLEFLNVSLDGSNESDPFSGDITATTDASNLQYLDSLGTFDFASVEEVVQTGAVTVGVVGLHAYGDDALAGEIRTTALDVSQTDDPSSAIGLTSLIFEAQEGALAAGVTKVTIQEPFDTLGLSAPNEEGSDYTGAFDFNFDAVVLPYTKVVLISGTGTTLWIDGQSQFRSLDNTVSLGGQTISGEKFSLGVRDGAFSGIDGQDAALQISSGNLQLEGVKSELTGYSSVLDLVFASGTASVDWVNSSVDGLEGYTLELIGDTLTAMGPSPS